MAHLAPSMRSNSVSVVFTWVLLTLFCFRVTRFVTTDTFPPMQATRDFFEKKMGPKWGELISCNWCASLYICVAIYAITAQLLSIPLPVLQVGATMSVVGFVGNYD